MRARPSPLQSWRAAALVAAGMAAVLGACAQPPVPEDRFYRLTVSTPAEARNTPVLSGTIQVERFVADGVAADRPIAYSRDDAPHELQAYHYHFWTDPPTTMIQNHMAAYLRSSGVATRIVTPEVRIEPDYIISGKIRRFEQVRGSPTKVVVEFELALKRMRDERLLRLDTERIELESRDETVGAAVAAISTAVSQIFEKFVSNIPQG